jgi:hypothetical protein
MTRFRSVLVVGGVLLLLAGCGANRAPSQSDVEDEVTRILVEDGYQDQTFDQSEAEDAAECIARTLFESGDFTEDQRDDVIRAIDGNPPDEELVSMTTAMVDGCVGGATTSGPDAPAGDDTEG